ncbi:MAG: tetratricopeptide repeat protein [Ktedonobacteraceae bacterium]
MDTEFFHAWIVAPYQRDREQAVRSIHPAGEVSYYINCHHNLRGPYTGTGEFLRKLAPMVYQQYPDLVIAHATEIVSIAPELKALTVSLNETLASSAVGGERTIYYSRLRTQRLAHGIVDFLLEYVALNQHDHYAIVFENVHMADPLDQEFLSVLLRRADPRQISVTLCTASTALTEPLLAVLTTHARTIQPQPAHEQHTLEELGIPSDWRQWLLHCTDGWQGEWEPFQQVAEYLATVPTPAEETTLAQAVQLILEHCPQAMRTDMACAYIESDCTADNLFERGAYDGLDLTNRQQLHDARAEELEKQEQWALHPGAIPFHREHGLDPSSLGVRTLQTALSYCLNMGFYEAVVDFGYRGRKLFDWEKRLDTYWSLTWDITTALAALNRGVEAEALFDEVRELTSVPFYHMQAAYATAMLYTRHHEPARLNLHVAKRWEQEAIAIAQLLPDPKERTFYTVFNQNGLALIEVRLKRPHEAQRLVVEGLERLERELEPGEHMLQRSVMIYNRAQVHNVFGRVEEAIADFTTLIELDPHYSEYYFERGNLNRKLGRNEEALQDYNSAIHYGPPYPEVYYNRAGVLSVLGQEDEALADYTYVLELDPSNLDALINRASILYERGEYASSRNDIEQGLALSPGNAQLLCTLGLVEMDEQHPEEAFQALTSALERDPTLVAAWANRAVLNFESGNVDASIADLTSALALSESATVLYNRGLAYQSQERWQDAIADYTRALELSDDDAHDIFYQRGVCYAKSENVLLARQDFAAHRAMGPSEHEDDIRQLEPLLMNK